MSRQYTHIPKKPSTHRGSAGWFLSDGTIYHEGVNLICGKCGKHAGDLRNHTIKADGTVHASILCPKPKCGWHVWGILDDWDTYENKARGVIYGQAIGDALGVGAEFLTKDKVAQAYPHGIPHYRDINWTWGFARPWQAGEWTDDTDQFLCIFDSILELDGVFHPLDVAKRFYQWYVEDGRGCGVTTQSILTAHKYLEAPFAIAERRWEESGMSNAPNGAVMRTAAVGLFYDSVEITKNVAKGTAQLTHWDPRCVASAQIISVIVQQFVRGKSLASVRTTVREMFEEHKNTFCLINDLPYIYEALNGDLESLELGTDGRSFGYTVKTLGAGLWALSDSAKDFASGIQAVIREGGDVDTNCAVAGAVLGARFGYNSLPQDLVQDLLRGSELEERVLKLLELHAAGLT